jgi:hypothetical protein
MSPAHREKLKNFDNLPNDALVPDAVAAAILGISLSSLKNRAPVPARQICDRRHGRRVGDLRALARGTEAAAA